MNGEACKFSHEPLTDKSRELLDKVSMYSLARYLVNVIDVDSCTWFVKILESRRNS